MLKIRALPALEGDCLWIEYGDESAPRRVLIDGGPADTYPVLRARIEKIPRARRHFELLVVTHIDDDHIGGVLELLKEAPSLGVTFGDVWFNGRQCLDMNPSLSTAQGDGLSSALAEDGVPWNVAFRKSGSAQDPPSYREAVVVPQRGELPQITLAGDGPRLTLLGPTRANLDALLPAWDTEVEKTVLLGGEGQPVEDRDIPRDQLLGALDVDALAAQPSGKDPSPSNASSIVLLLEYGEIAWLLAGDARHADIEKAVSRLLRARKKATLALDLFKLSHHGSRNNTSDEVLSLLTCTEYLVSTDGGGAKRAHPHQPAIAKIIKRGGSDPLIHFNYRTKYNEIWDVPALRRRHVYRTSYPRPGKEGISLVWR